MYLKSQMDLARRLDGKCQNPEHNKNACFSWILDVHHINGRGKEFLGVEHLILICRICHQLVEVDMDLMIKILESHQGKYCYRWAQAMSELRKKRDHLIYKRGQDERN